MASDQIRVRVSHPKNPQDFVTIEADPASFCCDIANAAAHLLFAGDAVEIGRFALALEGEPKSDTTTFFSGGLNLEDLQKRHGVQEPTGSIFTSVIVIDLLEE